MASPSIPPLRYQKSSNGASPSKPFPGGRPLSELSPMAIRRNSPSFPQNRGGLFKQDSSPAGSSPFSVNNVSSQRLFWQGRDTTSPSRENKDPNEATLSSSPTKRSSIENLKKASRVKNSTMFAKEQQNNYDPSRPTVLDGRPLSIHQGNAFIGRGSESIRASTGSITPVNDIIETADVRDFATSPPGLAPLSPSKLNVSPAKSSLSKRTGSNMRYSGFDPDSGIWEDEDDADQQERKLPEGRTLHRHAKSVTFDQAPPQVNEYEMTTPDPSSIASGSREGSYESMDEDEVDYSFEYNSSMDHDDSFDASLEDTDKTPVVLPEDWRFMSPDTANTELTGRGDDVFDDNLGSPEPNAYPGGLSYRPHQTSVNSVDSNGQPRPLPPIPGLNANANQRDSLSGAIERMSSSQRALPSPPPAASISKSDIRRMSGGTLSIEDRLKLMMIKDQGPAKPEIEIDRGHRIKRTESRDLNGAREEYLRSEEAALTQSAITASNGSVPSLSRLSISQQLRGANSHDEIYVPSSEIDRSSVHAYDPDVPIPSLEDPTQVHEFNDPIKLEESDTISLSSIPSYYGHTTEEPYQKADDDTSEYSQASVFEASIHHQVNVEHDTPRAQSLDSEAFKKVLLLEEVALPAFVDFGDENSFNLGLQAYMTPPVENSKEKPLPPPPPPEIVNLPSLPDLAALRATIERPFTPDEQLEPPKLSFSGGESSAGPGTPSSVIRHPVSPSPEPEVAETDSIGDDSRFTTRDLHSTSRGASSEPLPDEYSIDQPQEKQENKLLPALEISEPTQKRVSSLVRLELPSGSNEDGLGLGLGLEREFDRVVEAQKVAFELSLQHLYRPFHGRFPSGEMPMNATASVSHWSRNHRMQTCPGDRALIDLPHSISPFKPHEKREIANRNLLRQRGYLMRQNTKIVVATEQAYPDEVQSSTIPKPENPTTSVQPNEVQTSARKASQPTWVAEPWTSKSRRKSIKLGGEKAIAKHKPVEGSVPPLPGLLSNVEEGLTAVAEDDLAEEEAEEFEDGMERGRLFVKVVGVKDLQLPFPQRERTFFALTLDNGMHCVTTAWLDLAKDAPIGQEFELVVLNELEFQLTLQMKLESPKLERPVSPTKPLPSPKKQGAFGRLFGSPKKKKESDVRTSDIQVKRPVTPPSAYELVQGLVAKDGSFARAYVSLGEHEKYAYGRPYSVDIKCFNEWAMEQVPVGSSRSKKSVVELQQRPPYEIGKLELQLLYIPKPKGAKDEDMPKSMNSAIRALRDAEEQYKHQASIKEFQGYLSQQGGDCPYWRRRFFKLVGTKLTAYHETTLQPRATINLAKATKLIDDKSSLVQKETSTRGGGRRKSGFAEEEEGYMFVEEGFRIKFANGEVIDFYADSPASKEEWMVALLQVVGKSIPHSTKVQAKGWAEMVLKREKSLEKKAKADAQARRAKQHGDAKLSSPTDFLHPSGIPVPINKAVPQLPRGYGHTRSESYQAGDTEIKSTSNSPVKTKMTGEERRLKARSMVY